MATSTPKLLGRSTPGAASNTTAYTAPAVTKAIVSSIIVSNHSGAPDTIRIFVVPNGGSAATTNDITYDLVIPAGNPLAINAVPAMEAGDFISVYALNGGCTFTISGLEYA